MLVHASGRPVSTDVPRTGIPPILATRIGSRLQSLALFLIAVLTVLWLGVNAVEGQLAAEFRRPAQWLPPALTVAVSVGVIWLSRRWRHRPERLARVGLAYMVVCAYGVTFGTYWETFFGVPGELITIDRVGFSGSMVWLFGYVALVPSRLRDLAVALPLAAAALPLCVLWQTRLGIAPVLSPVDFLIVFCLPQGLVAAVAFGIAAVISRLGHDVDRARELGAYRLERRIGAGNMGEVWQARHAMLARPAAIKMIQPRVLAQSADAVADAVARFEREARLTATLQSPHSVQVYDYGMDADGSLYYVMELLDGVDLETLVRQYGPVVPERAGFLLAQICESLEEAHRRGLVHRDIKPANVHLTRLAHRHDFVKVLDFGLAKEVSTVDAGATLATGSHTVLGTPAYMAPEAVRGGVVDARSDLYSLGCVAFWLLTGDVPFAGLSPFETLMAHVQDPPAPPSSCMSGSLPAEFDDLVLACLAKTPADRPQTARAVSERIAALPLPAPWNDERAARWWAAHQPP